jgi:hypothetical protein
MRNGFFGQRIKGERFEHRARRKSEGPGVNPIPQSKGGSCTTQSPHSGKHDADTVEETGREARPLPEVRCDRGRIPSGYAIMSGSFLTGKLRPVGGMLQIHPAQSV